MKTNVQPYYRLRLRQELEKRLDKNPRYSLRALARTLGVESGAFSQILSGKRTPSLRVARRLVDSLGLTPKETHQFLVSLSAVQRSRNLDRANPFFRKLKSEQETVRPKELSTQLFQVIADWYHYAILELTQLPNFSSDPKWIARELGISQLEAKLAVQRLLELGLLEEQAGKTKKSQEKLVTADHHLTSVAHKRHQKQILEKALTSLENDPLEVRSMTSVLMAIDPRKISEAKALIQEFNGRMMDFLTTDPQSCVYALGVSLYPVQKQPHRSTS